MAIAAPLAISEIDKAGLRRWLRAPSTPQGIVLRAKIVLAAASGMPNLRIARDLSVGRPTVLLWRRRFAEGGLPALREIKEGRGRKRSITDKKVEAMIADTLHGTPPDATHWSTRTLAEKHGVSNAFVKQVWDAAGLKPHLARTFKVSNDPQFIEKLRDVVGLYLNPPEHALVMSVDEKSQIQALDRTQPGLPMKKGRCGTMTHDYKRNGTTTLFAALSMLDGKVIGECMPRHRHQEFIRFLKTIDTATPAEFDLHIIADNYATHKHPRVKSWLRRHPRFHLHFIPTSSSWLNMVERWFREITDKRIRRGSFAGVPELIAAIQAYLDGHNQNPHIFTWTASAADILTKVAKCKEALDSLHQVSCALGVMSSAGSSR